MRSPTLIPWTELLSECWSNVRDEYGLNSQAVASAFMALAKARWLEGRHAVARVRSPE
jgi:hypothetical protein